MEKLIVRLRIEEENKKSEKKSSHTMVVKENVVESDKPNKRKHEHTPEEVKEI